MGTETLLWPMKVSKPKPPPIPELLRPPTKPIEAEEAAMKKARRRRGWQKTIITGELIPETTKKTQLG